MKKIHCRMLALLMALMLLLTGCNSEGLGSLFEDLYSAIELGMMTPFEDMVYTRPDPNQFQQDLDACMEQIKTETDVDAMMETIYDLYYQYYDFNTNYQLSNIHYCRDMTDLYWSEEYSFCLEAATDISAGMDNLLYALADSPLREELEQDDFFGEGFFEAYEGDSLWDETFTALMAEEAALLDRYYELNAAATEDPYYSDAFFENYGHPIEEVFVELVRVRREIAEYAGYESYPAFAYEFYFYRDYTPDQAARYVEQIRQELVPLYLELDDSVWNGMYLECTEEQTMTYLRQTAKALGGTAENALKLLEGAKLYDITYSENKYDASFEVYLPSYNAPFVFVNPTGSIRDKLTLVHEFGHFCNDYAAGGSMVGVDVAEVFSQSLEYLSLTKAEGENALKALKLADSLSVYVEQAAYARFELEVYDLQGAELTVENVRAVYQSALDDFGLSEYGRDARDYVLIPHFFISGQYVISYVVSNDVAMQIYRRELETAGSGVQIWSDGLVTMQAGILGFVEEAGLEDPFADGAVAKIRAVFEDTLSKYLP